MMMSTPKEFFTS